MNRISDVLFNIDERENIIRREVKAHLKNFSQPDTSESIVATYFIHTMPHTSIEESATEIARLQTTGEKYGKGDSILQRSTGHFIDSIPFDAKKTCGPATMCRISDE